MRVDDLCFLNHSKISTGINCILQSIAEFYFHILDHITEGILNIHVKKGTILTAPAALCYTKNYRPVGREHSMTRDEILLAASKIIAEKGFHATSMQEIAESVDLRKASLYHHVSSKQEILVALLDMALDLLIEQLQEVVDQSLPARDKFILAMKVYLNTLITNRGLSSVLLLEHRSLDAKMHAKHVPQRDKFEALWRSIIDDGITSGEFVSTDSNLAIKQVLGIANWTIMWFQPDGPLSISDIAEKNAFLLLDGFSS